MCKANSIFTLSFWVSLRFLSTFASSAPSSASHKILVQFNITKEVSYLTTTTFLLGYVFGVSSLPIFFFEELSLMSFSALVLGPRQRVGRSQACLCRSHDGLYLVYPRTSPCTQYRNVTCNPIFLWFFRCCSLTNSGGMYFFWGGITFPQYVIRCHCGYLASSWTRSSHDPLYGERFPRSRSWGDRCRVVSSCLYSHQKHMSLPGISAALSKALLLGDGCFGS
jgi:hypothetical protein